METLIGISVIIAGIALYFLPSLLALRSRAAGQRDPRQRLLRLDRRRMAARVIARNEKRCQDLLAELVVNTKG